MMNKLISRVVLSWSLVATPAAYAANFVVTSAADAVDAALDGTCASAAGDCTLRAAIQEANNTVEKDTITMQSNVRLILSGSGEDAAASGDLDITSNIEIESPFTTTPAIINTGGTTSGALGEPHFDVKATGTLVLRDIVLKGTKGIPLAGTDPLVVGGIKSAGTVTLVRVQLLSMHAPQNSSPIASSGSLTINSSTFINLDGTNGGAIGTSGAGSTLQVQDTEFRDNTATGSGGAIFANGAVQLQQTLFNDNTGGDGGAVAIASGNTTADNCTFSHNLAAKSGGALHLLAGAVVVTSSTIVLNHANTSATTAHGGGVFVAASKSFTVDNTIIASNVEDGGNATKHPDISGVLISTQGHNLLGSIIGATLSGTTVGNVSNTDPGLLPLADNGGSTKTHALASTASPAYEAAGACLGADGDPLTTDQRGGAFTRRQGTCDIGAFEADALDVKLTASSTAAIAGSNIVITVQLQTEGFAPVPNLILQLSGLEAFTFVGVISGASFCPSQPTLLGVLQCKLLQVAANDNKEIQVELGVPADAPSILSIVANSKPLTNDTNASNNTATLDISVAPKPEEPPADVVPPADTPAEQTQTEPAENTPLVEGSLNTDTAQTADAEPAPSVLTDLPADRIPKAQSCTAAGADSFTLLLAAMASILLLPRLRRRKASSRRA